MLDTVTAGDMVAAAVPVVADRWWLTRLLNTSSSLVTAVQDPGKGTQVVALSSSQLAGGTFVAASGVDVTAALFSCRIVDIQVFAMITHTDQPNQESLRAHCTFMAGAGSGECNGWVGMPTLSAFTAIKTRARALNTRHLSLAAQDIEAFDAAGNTVQYAPDTLALMFAAMQASSAIATPLTRKTPLVNAVITNADWDGDVDAEEALENGIVFLTNYRLGLRVERSITTYLVDDNPIFSEMSANESLNTCIRDLRENLDLIIGDPNVETTAAKIQSLSKARLLFQADNNIIKAFDADSLAMDDFGDFLRVRFSVAVTEPVNWIVVQATASRTPFNQ